MKAITFVAVTVFAAVAASAVHSSAGDNTLPDNWTANFSLANGENYTGYYIYDKTAQRTFRRIHELNQSTFVFQSFGEPMMYIYNIGSAGCTCSTHKGGFIPNFWASFPATASGGSCAGGTLYTSDKVTMALPGAPTQSYCVSGTTPVWREEDGSASRYTFTNFKATTGGADSFPFDQFNGWVKACSNACI